MRSARIDERIHLPWFAGKTRYDGYGTLFCFHDRRYHLGMSVFSMVIARPKRGFVYAAMVLLAVTVPPAFFYGWFELQSHRMANRHALDSGYANALKHAEAAATIYSWLRLVGVSDSTSEQIVIRLGIANEYIELYVKRGRKDTTLEMMRDLHSNMVGISVARWRERNETLDQRSRSEQLVALVGAGVLLRSEDDVSLSPEDKPRAKQSADLDWALDWFERNRAAIEQWAMQALQDTRP
jgi:hypothetical protein